MTPEREVVTPEVMPDDNETAVSVANALTAQIAETAQHATRRIAGAREWLDTHGGTVTAETVADAKHIRTGLNYAEKETADRRKAIQKAVAAALADTIQPLVDAEKAAKALSVQFKAAIDALDAKPKCTAPHYVEIVCDQYQWPKITEAVGKVLKDSGSFAELDPKWVRIPKELKGGSVPV